MAKSSPFDIRSHSLSVKAVSQTSGHVSRVDNPHSVSKSQIGLGNVDNTSDINKPISTAQQQALDLKQDILSEGAFVDGDKTKLDSVETNATADQTAAEIKELYESNSDTNIFTDDEKTRLSNTESSSQLDDRDTNNRDRSNHTGTQLANTISDFDSAVKSNETVTSISIDSDTLTYIDEDSNTTDIDLSDYLHKNEYTGTLEVVTDVDFTNNTTTKKTITYEDGQITDIS